jgi:DNA-binding HxlR family transcriptional regulator
MYKRGTRQMKPEIRQHACPVETGLELISGKWKPRLLWKFYNQGTLRFGELKRTMPAITAKMLTQQLRELERDGLVLRKIYPEVPPKVEYSLSDFGRTLGPILDLIAHWSTSEQQKISHILIEQEGVQPTLADGD